MTEYNFNTFQYMEYIIFHTLFVIYLERERERERNSNKTLYKDFYKISIDGIKKNSSDANALFLVLILFYCMGGE